MKNTKGFTLIELMITVSIIGILASIALPSYQIYVKRAHVLEGLNLAGGSKTAIWDYWSSNGQFPSTNASAGVATTIKGNSVDSVELSSNEIIITYNDKVENNKTIILRATNGDGSLVWDCKTGTLSHKYRPVNCR